MSWTQGSAHIRPSPRGRRFEEPLANLLNEQHRTMKELLEQLKMRKSSARQQQEAERVKPQPEKAQQTLILDPAQRQRLQHQMQQVRLRRAALALPGPRRHSQAPGSGFGKVRNVSSWCRGNRRPRVVPQP